VRKVYKISVRTVYQQHPYSSGFEKKDVNYKIEVGFSEEFSKITQ